MAIAIRTLCDTDLETADAILGSAFQRSESWQGDLRLFLELQPGGIFLAYQEDRPAGMVAAILYSNVGYAGLMGVRQEFQRQGLGLALMRHLLAWLDQQGVQQVLLDASPLGQPLYEKLGFVAGDQVYVLQRPTGQPEIQRPTEVQLISRINLDRVTATDMGAFGADRRGLLQALLKIYPERAFLLVDDQGHLKGYLIVQEKRIGPWVMEDPSGAELLLRAALSLPFRGPVSVVVPGENSGAIALLHKYGFEIARVNRHMMRVSDVPVGQREKIFAQTSLSLG